MKIIIVGDVTLAIFLELRSVFWNMGHVRGSRCRRFNKHQADNQEISVKKASRGQNTTYLRYQSRRIIQPTCPRNQARAKAYGGKNHEHHSDVTQYVGILREYP